MSAEKKHYIFFTHASPGVAQVFYAGFYKGGGVKVAYDRDKAKTFNSFGEASEKLMELLINQRVSGEVRSGVIEL